MKLITTLSFASLILGLNRRQFDVHTVNLGPENDEPSVPISLEFRPINSLPPGRPLRLPPSLQNSVPPSRPDQQISNLGNPWLPQPSTNQRNPANDVPETMPTMIHPDNHPSFDAMSNTIPNQEAPSPDRFLNLPPGRPLASPPSFPNQGPSKLPPVQNQPSSLLPLQELPRRPDPLAAANIKPFARPEFPAQAQFRPEQLVSH